ncbi:MAG: aminopeptidase P family protein [bacterium]|nr:aminopeptidase P family protein [bacterium]
MKHSFALLWIAAAAACTAPRGQRVPEAAREVIHAPTPEQRYLDWTSLRFAPEVYAARRERLAQLLAATGGGVFLAPSAAGRSHGATFRQEDDFLYFTGLELPDSVLAVTAGGVSVVYAPRRDARFESASRQNDFPGRPLADDPELARAAGIAIEPIEALLTGFSSIEPKRVNLTDTQLIAVWADLGRSLRQTQMFSQGPVYRAGPVEAFLSQALIPDARSAHDEVARLRMVKGPEEIAVIRRACTITCDAIRASALAIEDGVDERTLEAELEAAFKRGGAQRRAFDSIIKSGPNSLWPWRILAAHYDRRNRAMHDGELVIYDVGCELDHYASDVGRTFPVSGTFSPRQREALELVTSITDAVIDSVRPGVTFADLRAVIDARIPADQKPYMQARLFFGHHIGLDVGDANLADEPLVPGMVFTIEPWYYNHDEDLAVFIEDNVVVTADGCENLTADLPRSVGELERMVGGGH